MTTKNDTSPQPIKRLVLNRERVRNLGLQTGVRTGAIAYSTGGNSAGSIIINSASKPPIWSTDSISASEFSIGGGGDGG